MYNRLEQRTQTFGYHFSYGHRPLFTKPDEWLLPTKEWIQNILGAIWQPPGSVEVWTRWWNRPTSVSSLWERGTTTWCSSLSTIDLWVVGLGSGLPTTPVDWRCVILRAPVRARSLTFWVTQTSSSDAVPSTSLTAARRTIASVLSKSSVPWSIMAV